MTQQTKPTNKRPGDFIDAEDREWSIRIDAPTIQEVREQHGIDLCDLSEANQWHRLENDLCLRVDVLWTVCREQAEEAGIDPRSFAKGMVGDGLGNATEALLDSIEGFFPPDRRSLFRALCAKNQAVIEEAMTLAISRLKDEKLQERLRTAMATRMDSELDEQLTRLSSRTDTRVPSA